MHTLPKRFFIVLALASALAVGNLYYVQPLLERIATDLGLSAEQGGWLVTAVQLGYATGVVTLLPLGDLYSRKRLVPAMMTLSAAALVVAGFAQSYVVLISAMALVGITTIAGQLLIPLTSELSDDSNRGKNVSTVVSGMILGILLSRTLAGALSDAFSWHLAFVVDGVLTLAIAAIVWRQIPELPAPARVPYRSLISGVFKVFVADNTTWRYLLSNGTMFGMMTAIWTSITFLLSGPKFHMTPSQIGLWGIVGAIGAVTSRFAGRFLDSGREEVAVRWYWLVAFVAIWLGAMAESSLVWLAVELILFDLSMPAIGVISQTYILKRFAHVRSRANAAYVATNFVSGAIGSALAALLWVPLGWVGVQWLCAILTGLAFLLRPFRATTQPVA